MKERRPGSYMNAMEEKVTLVWYLWCLIEKMYEGLEKKFHTIVILVRTLTDLSRI
jgi:hypothetical protein